MTKLRVIKHAKGSPGLSYLGLGPMLRPCKGVKQLQLLFNRYTFWAQNRTQEQIKKMLAHSTVAVSAWKAQKLIGFGRASTDTEFRGVLWDIIVEDEEKGSGVGSQIINLLLNSKELMNVEKIYLMTTNSSEFYKNHGFKYGNSQKLLVKKKKNEY